MNTAIIEPIEVNSNGIAIWSCGTAVLTASMMGALGQIAVSTPRREAEMAAMGVRELDFSSEVLGMVIRLNDCCVAFDCNGQGGCGYKDHQ